MKSLRRGVVLQGVDTPHEFVNLAKRFEEQGFDHLWLTESSLHARDPYQLLALAGMHTSTLRLGTAVTNPVTRHPALTAVAAATLAEATEGRSILGIGAGDRPLVALGTKPARLAQLELAVDAIRRLLAGEHVDVESPSFDLVDAHLRFPVETKIPIFVSASGPRTLELAGEIADGVILLCGLDPVIVEWALERISAGADRRGRPRPEVAIFVYGVIDEDEDVAIASARSIAAWFPQTSPLYCELAGLDLKIAQAVRDQYSGGEFQEAAAAAELLPVEFVQKMAVAGDRARITGQLSELAATGIDSINIFPLGDDRVRTIDAFEDCWRRMSISD
ncbi:MAG: LLM class flavin-dependent oxidoreductase [Acidimicrobiales bacterium]|nr:LLM class flavin-dependent oxidoreductase [Acidimicrobiales bacterium]